MGITSGRDPLPVHSPLLKQSQLLALPPLSDMLKFGGLLHVHQVTIQLCFPERGALVLALGSFPLGAPGASSRICIHGFTSLGSTGARLSSTDHTCRNGPFSASGPRGSRRCGATATLKRGSLVRGDLGPVGSCSCAPRGVGALTRCTSNADAQAALGRPHAGQLRSGLFLCVDHRTLHITKHIGGSSALHHDSSQDIHHDR